MKHKDKKENGGKREKDFILELEGRAREQKKLVGSELLPKWAKGIGEWLVVNPWRVLVPSAVLIYLGLRAGVGVGFREVILAIFGGY